MNIRAFRWKANTSGDEYHEHGLYKLHDPSGTPHPKSTMLPAFSPRGKSR
ncbi:MAG TPA: hypothetical protein VKM55_01780 [Candidatus Lokiarchaeia archaeon]|nr:hypothetical protein [Candidatus Lokiarchaeia archaeon]